MFLWTFVVYMSQTCEMPSLGSLSLKQIRAGKDVLKWELEELRRKFDSEMVAFANREALRPCVSAGVFSSEADLRRQLADAEAELDHRRTLSRQRAALAEQAARSAEAGLDDLRTLNAGAPLAEQAPLPVSAAPVIEIELDELRTLIAAAPLAEQAPLPVSAAPVIEIDE